MATYYVTNAGSDSANGTSTDTPWATLAKVNASASTGDTINLARGSMWRESIVPKNNQVFQAYGDGLKPSIRGSEVAGSWTQESATLWFLPSISTDPEVVVFAGTLGRRRTSKGAMTQTLDYWWDDPNDRLYVYGQPSGTIEYGVRTAILGNYQGVNVTFTNLDVRHNRGDIVFGYYSTNTATFTGVDFTAIGGYGIQANNGGLVAVDACTFTDWGVRRATTIDNYAVQVIGEGSRMDVTNSRFVITGTLPRSDVMAINCDVHGWLRTCTGNYIDGNGSMDEGILIYGPGVQATSTTISENEIYRCGIGILLQNLEADGTTGTYLVSGNLLVDCCGTDEADTDAVKLADFTASSTVTVCFNRVIGTVDGANSHHGIRANAARGALIANNLVIGTDDGIRFDNDFGIRTPSGTVVNNIVSNVRGAAGRLTGSGSWTEGHNLWNGTRSGFTAASTSLVEQIPVFTGTVEKPYHLRPSSPGAGAGTPVSGVTAAALGAVSMGAFERPASTTKIHA